MWLLTSRGADALALEAFVEGAAFLDEQYAGSQSGRRGVGVGAASGVGGGSLGG